MKITGLSSVNTLSKNFWSATRRSVPKPTVVRLEVLIFKAGDLSNAVRYTLRGVAIIAAIYIVWRDYNPAYKIGWIILISALPIMGGVLYVLFGNKRPIRGLKKKFDPVENISLAYLEQKEKIEEICRGGRIRGTLKYISEKGGYPAWTGTESKYFDSGEKYFESFIADLEKAKHFIFLEYFIIKKRVITGNSLTLFSNMIFLMSSTNSSSTNLITSLSSTMKVSTDML